MSRPFKPYDAGALRRRLLSSGMWQGDCCEWTGYCNPKTDYGQVSLIPSEQEALQLGRIATVPQVACSLAHGLRPEGLYVLHACDNRPCFAEGHLSWGTASENMLQAWDRNRQKMAAEHHLARLDDNQIISVLRRYRSGERSADLAAECGVTASSILRWNHGKGRGKWAVEALEAELCR